MESSARSSHTQVFASDKNYKKPGNNYRGLNIPLEHIDEILPLAVETAFGTLQFSLFLTTRTFFKGCPQSYRNPLKTAFGKYQEMQIKIESGNAMVINIIPFFSPLASNEWKPQILNRLRAIPSVQIISVEDFLNELNQNTTLLNQHTYLFVGTGGTENKIAQFINKTKLNPPITLLSYDENNSLPAAMETRAYLQQNNLSAQIVHGSLDQLAETLRTWQEFAEVEKTLRNARLGVIGTPSSWLIASNVDYLAVQQRWGTNIEMYPLVNIRDHLKGQMSKEFNSAFNKFVSTATQTTVSEKELIKAGIVAQAMLEFVQRENLDAVTVECFALLLETNTSGCYALSHLNNLAHITAGCEGDVPTTFTMLLAKLLTQQPVFMANVVDVDLETNSVIFAHCTVPTSILSQYEITTHFETGRSVAIRGTFESQEITVLKVAGADLSTFWSATGIITQNLTNEQACRTQIRATLSEPVHYFLEESLANHHVIILGNHQKKIQEFFSFILRQ